ncbi:acyl-CoA dehydrogenase family protein [Roseateles saccharophilus]|uniref:Acyl-[acyl-carrier-protein] dehydrogenase MbtN n=1 Tax=Roseateles saccharophilus TaxID=304 RepID=A0A4R3VDL5_ROSSA|nr:acyl-CoA dehydrogenase family protein [Roseateles saccharophilus]MDG0834399.1 acyl-CoA dehydrogenase [Roseateles saccharophilus]TCV02003.1 acyl-CoA dehydrogenase/long-chain-acyl-CoA dehydrogenase [Roseateles saccharophilus]
MPLPLFPSPWMREEHHLLQQGCARFFAERWLPRAAGWRERGQMERDTWREAGAQGLLCAAMPEEFGGSSGDFGHEAVIVMEAARANLGGFGGSVHSAIVAPYLLHHGSDEQRRRWLPALASGERVGAIAMTEPGTGSDLQAIRTRARHVTDEHGDHYVISGQKTFITNGQNADLIVIVCRTGDAPGARGLSLIVAEVDAGTPGLSRRRLDKIGMKAQDTSELFFDELRVPAANLLGASEGLAFGQLMQELPQERLVIAAQAVAMMERALDDTIAYAKQREAFGQPIWNFQNTRFVLAQAQSDVLAARALLDAAISAHLRQELDAARAALVKAWCSDLASRLTDACLQLFGGYGYMLETPIAELWADARVTRIYGGTNEIMKELASRQM